MTKFYILYAKKTTTEDGDKYSYPFYKSESSTLEEAQKKVDDMDKEVTVDEQVFTLMPKIFQQEKGETIKEVLDRSKKEFALLEPLGDQPEQATGEYHVIYAKITEDKEVGVLVSFSYIGGLAETMEEAEKIARDLVNDKEKSQQATIIPKIFKNKSITGALEEADQRFKRMKRDIYDSEDIMSRRNKK